jgi:hypothetical protein
MKISYRDEKYLNKRYIAFSAKLSKVFGVY